LDEAIKQRILGAIESIKAGGARIAFVYLPTSGEILSRQVYTFDDDEKSVLRFYEEHLGVPVTYPSDYAVFDGITEFAISRVDSHPSVELQRAYGRYLAAIFADALRQADPN
jgi:hypothetical protein